jgi:type II secretory pathway component PulK
MALVSLVLVAVLTGTLVRWAAMEHKLIRVEENESQARWLAEAGIERAAVNLVADAGYSGETWDLDATQLPSREKAQVRLKITPVENQERARTIEVDVEYGLAGKTPIRLHKEVIYQFPSGETP